MLSKRSFVFLCSMLIAAGASVSAPLLVYATALAIFGLPHVLSEFRYVDRRFGQRIGTYLGHSIAILLGGIVVTRVLALIPSWQLPQQSMELYFVLGLVALTLPTLARSSPFALALGLLVIGALGYGLSTSPATTLVILAVLHNLTPLGFIAEACHGRQRRQALCFCLLAFLLLPVIIVTGQLEQAIVSIFGIWPDLSAGHIGGLSAHLGVYVPSQLTDRTLTRRLFSAAVYLQCLHYAVVIHVLPKLGETGRGTIVPWPNQFRRFIVFSGILAGTGFYWAFADSRALYGIIAAVHAWVEIPILLLCLGTLPKPQPRVMEDA